MAKTTSSEETKRLISNNLVKLMRLWGKNNRQMALLINCGGQANWSNYINAKNLPTLDTMLSIQRKTGVSIFDLCTREVALKEFPLAPLPDSRLSETVTQAKKVAEPEQEHVYSRLSLQERVFALENKVRGIESHILKE